jgi:hypothetical protein
LDRDRGQGFILDRRAGRLGLAPTSAPDHAGVAMTAVGKRGAWRFSFSGLVGVGLFAGSQKSIVVEGGASITLQVVDPDCAMVKNCQSFASATCVPFVVADVPPAPNSFDGQFVQLDVVSVAAAE